MTAKATGAARLRRTQGRPAREIETEAAGPTRERLLRAGADVFRQGDGVLRMRDSPIERAFARGVISGAQYNAALKYRHHWYRAGLSGPLASLDLERVFSNDASNYSGMAKTEAQVFHRQRYREAVQALGAIGAAVVEQCVCREESLEQAGIRLGWASKPQAIAAATERMKMALDQLAALWGLG
jgi:hypothetical protein